MNIVTNTIEHGVEIKQNEILRLTGKNNVPIYTLDQITLDIFEYPTVFNSLPNSVPVFLFFGEEEKWRNLL